MDELEKFIRENRTQLDQFEPPEDAWEKLSRRLEEGKKSPKVIQIHYSTLWKVAAVITLAVMSYVGYQQYNASSDQKQQAVARPGKSGYQNPELKEAEAYYASQIESKKEEIRQYAEEHPEMYEELNEAMNALDSAYYNLKQELVEIPEDQERVEEAMINNLKLRIDILNQQLRILERIQKLKKDKEDENRKDTGISA